MNRAFTLNVGMLKNSDLNEFLDFFDKYSHRGKDKLHRITNGYNVDS